MLMTGPVADPVVPSQLPILVFVYVLGLSTTAYATKIAMVMSPSRRSAAFDERS
jgi:hypothetical protein